MTGRWVHSWVSMQQLAEPGDLPPAPFTRDNLVLADCTLRQTIRASVGGRRVRLRLSNAYGGATLPMTATSVALPAGGRAGTGAIQPGTSRRVTFDGRPSVDIRAGAHVVSDPLGFTLAPRSNLTVSVYLADGQASTDITTHPGSRTTSHIVPGNRVRYPDLPGASPIEHWYFLSGLEVLSTTHTTAAVMLGDSLTDGRGSTTNGNDRWPDRLLDRLQAHPGTAHVAILNQAGGGNRVLTDDPGTGALGRLDRDVLAYDGVTALLVFEGVNDIGTAEATETAQKQVTDDLVGAYDHLVRRGHAAGIRVYGGTITPFGGNPDYDDPAGTREASRRAVNDWIRTGDRFDAVVDFDRAARDPAHPRRLLPAFDVGDHLHLNPSGHKALADAVPAQLFRRQTTSQ
jgi:lysophospholipase L1-like esterase